MTTSHTLPGSEQATDEPVAATSGGAGSDSGDPGLRPRPRRERRRRGPLMLLVSLLAELLIIGGVGVVLYAVWNAWWTDLVASQHQSALIQNLHQKPAAAPKPASPSASAAPVEQHGPAPVLAEPSGIGSVFGTMQIPRFGLDYNKPIGEGTDRVKVLDSVGLGHYQGTAMPGAQGNFAVAGHRVTYGKPLNQIATIKVGDAIVVRVTDASNNFDVWYVYKVTSTEIVLPTALKVIAPVPDQPGVQPGPNDHWLTLTSCNPEWFAYQRYIVHAKLDYWMQASAGTPAELTEAPQ